MYREREIYSYIYIYIYLFIYIERERERERERYVGLMEHTASTSFLDSGRVRTLR